MKNLMSIFFIVALSSCAKKLVTPTAKITIGGCASTKGAAQLKFTSGTYPVLRQDGPFVIDSSVYISKRDSNVFKTFGVRVLKN